MKPEAFKAANPILDEIADLAEQQLSAPEVHRLLSKLAKAVGEYYSVSINLTVDVFDEERLISLPVLTTGLNAIVGKEPHRIWGDSTPQRYVIKDGIQVVPHDRCPKCWKVWDFKFEHPTCPHCDVKLGEDCKILLDSDVCPNCEDGKVTASKPCCKRCGFEVDPRTVVWG